MPTPTSQVSEPAPTTFYGDAPGDLLDAMVAAETLQTIVGDKRLATKTRVDTVRLNGHELDRESFCRQVMVHFQSRANGRDVVALHPWQQAALGANAPPAHAAVSVTLLHYTDTLPSNMYRAVTEEVRAVAQDTSGGVVTEELGFHGTTLESVKLLFKNGFNVAGAGQNGAAYGHGVYVGQNHSMPAHASYSVPMPNHRNLAWVVVVKIVRHRVMPHNQQQQQQQRGFGYGYGRTTQHTRRQDVQALFNDYDILHVPQMESWVVPRGGQVLPIGLICIRRPG